MKALLILILTFFLLTSCDSARKDPETILRHDVVVMVDNTEGGLYKWTEILRPEDLVNLFTIDGKQHYGSVTFTDINDVSLNRVQTEKLFEPLPYTKGATDLTRKGERENNQKELVNSFLKVSELYKSFVDKGSMEEKENSILYCPIVKGINRLAGSKADEKTVIILSDMIENSDCGNFYKATKKDYNQIIDDLIKCSNITLAQNSGVKVIVLFRTTSPEKDKQFTRSMEIWDLLFKKAGISYEILPNL